MKCCSKCGQPLPCILKDRYGTEIHLLDIMLWVPMLFGVPENESNELPAKCRMTLLILESVHIDTEKETYTIRGRTYNGMEFSRSGYLEYPVYDLISLHTGWENIREGLDRL